MNDLFDSMNIIDGGMELFGFDELEAENPKEEQKEPEKSAPETEKKTPVEEPDFTDEDLFEGEDSDDEGPEGVDGKENIETEEKTVTKGNGSSPNGRTFSSLAKALYGDGLFTSLDEDTIAGINDSDSFYEAFEKEIANRLDEKTKRINEALDANVPVDTIRQYEQTISQLKDITDETLSEETDKGKNLRTTILYQDYINRGFTKERAMREVKRIFQSGTDIDDSREALESVKEFFENKYEQMIEEGRKETELEKKKVREESAQFKKALLDTDKVFGEIEVDKTTRQKAYDLMTKIVKTNEDGEKLTAVQAYADEHPVEFRTMLGILAAMTDGFTKPGNLLKTTVEKKVRSNLKEFEAKLQRNPHGGGILRLAEGEDDEQQTARQRFRLDI